MNDWGGRAGKQAPFVIARAAADLSSLHNGLQFPKKWLFEMNATMRSLFFASILALGSFGSESEAASCEAPVRSETIAVSGHPFAAVATSDGCWMFVSLGKGNDSGAIGVLKNTDGRYVVDHQVDIGAHAFGEALSRDGRLLVVAMGKDAQIFDVSALEQGQAPPMATLHLGRNAGAIYAAISRDDKLLFVSEEENRRINVYDLETMRSKEFKNTDPIGYVKTANAPVGLAISADGRWLYATNEAGPDRRGAGSSRCAAEGNGGKPHPEGLLLVVDVQRAASDPEHALLGGYPSGCNPVRVASSPDGKQLFVTARGDNALLRFQMNDWTAATSDIRMSRYTIGSSPVGVVVRPDGKQVWVALSNRFGKDSEGKLAGLADISTDAPDRLLSAPAPGFPREVTFLPDGKTLVATLFDGNQIEIVRTPD